jgi:CHAT domain-containing protein/tetratricopeptide (TPR) repeat protein
MNRFRFFLCLPLVAGFSFLSSPFSKSSKAAIQEPPFLELNKLIDRNIAQGEIHAYRVRLVAGDFIHINTESKEVLLGYEVSGPDGRQVLDVGKLGGTPFGVKPVSLVAETSGDYLIKIRPVDKPGKYKILLDALRPATPQDRSRARGEAAFVKADALFQRGRKEDLQQAVEILRASLSQWRAAEIPLAEADALTVMGLAHRRLGEMQQAIERYQQAFEIFQKQNWDIGGALMLNNIGVAYAEMGDRAMAIRYYLPVTKLWRQFNNSVMYGMTMTNLGASYGAVGEFRKSLETLEEALQTWKTLDNQKWKSNTFVKLGTVYGNLGEPEIAADYCHQAFQLWRESDGLLEKTQHLTCIGGAQADFGNYTKAIEYQSEALKICQEIGNSNCQVSTASGLGMTYFAMKDYPRSAECFQQALEISRAAKNLYNEAKLLSSLGRVHAILNDLPTAERLLRQSYELQQTIGDTQGEAMALGGLARVYRHQGRLGESLAAIQQSLALIEQQRQTLSGHSSQAAYFSRLHEHQEFYLGVQMQLHAQSPEAGHAVAAFQASEHSRARSLLEALREARSDIRQGVDANLLQRETVVRQQLFYKEQVLADLLAGKNGAERIATAKKEVETLLLQKREIEALIRARSPRYAALTQPQPLNLAEIQKQVLDDDTALLEYAMGGERSYLFAVTKASFDVYELPVRAEIEELATEFYRLSARTFMDGGKWTIESENKLSAIAAKLSKMILAPAAASLKKKRLLVVAEGALQYIPFAALPDGDSRPLIASHEIVSLPSASTLAVLRRELNARQVAPKTLAVLGDPVFSANDTRLVASAKSIQTKTARGLSAEADTLRRSLRLGGANVTAPLQLSRLNHTRDEALSITALVPADSKLLALGFDANRQLATSDKLSQYRIVHFATHGWMDAAKPDLSAVVLSLVNKEGKPQNGFLRLHEIYNLNLPAELVVLSACETGIGKDIKGEGLISLTRGFMYAGARRVLVSLWPVDDPATAELMKRFYRGMIKENLTPSVALKKAQLEMQRQARWRSPYYWAGFVLQGEW